MRTGRLGEVNSCFVNYLSQRTYHSARPDWSPGISSSVFLSRRLDSSRDLYHKDLYAHYGCVNAIEFSASGDLLVSGGDDRRVLLWNIDGVLSENRPPQAMKGEHNSNIFCLSFDSCNSKIFSAGNDEQVIVHDLKTGDLVDVFLHREAVYGVSVNPTLDSVFASAGEDGQILMYDMRESPASDPVCLARYHDAFHSVQFHPSEPTFIVTANSREGVSLWDVRKPKVPVLRYGEKQCAQSSMCAKFNRMGTQIVALRRRLPPILYDTQYSKPVSEFDAEHYYNSCTMKSCCFAGDRDQFILSGSDDFNLYMWKIPQSKRGGYFVSEEEEEEAHMVLKGHRSIVNQVRFNPHNLIIASSGVEKIVKLWSGVSLPGSKGSLQTKSCRNFMSRRVYTYEEYIGLVMESGQDVNHDYSHGSTDEDPRMMAFFDSLVQRELEGWTSNTDLSSHDDQEEEEDDNDVETTQQMLSPDEEEEEDNDTEEATQSSSSSSSSSSAVTSQSEDDNDSAHIHGPSGAQRHGTSSRSTTYAAEGGHRGGQSWAARSSSRRCRGLPNETRKDDDDDDDDDEDDEANKQVSGASEWIMCMIAKKRAQLRAASARRKNLSSRRQHKKTRRHQHKFLRCSYTKTNTSSRRRYLYHPAEESQRNGNQDVQPQPQQQEQEQQANGESPLSLPSAMSSTVAMRRRRRRRHSFRRYMAPYTIMVVDSDLQSSEEEEDEEEPHQQEEEEEANANQDHNHSSDGRAGQASLPRPQSAADAETNGAVNKRKRRPQQLWSAPDGSHSSGNDNGRRRRRISGERSSHVGGGSSRRSDEGDLENGRGPWCSSSQENGAKNGHVISWEIVDCNNASEEEGEESEVEIRSRSNGVTRTTTLNVMNSLPGGSEGTGGNRNNLVSNLGSVGVSDSSVVAASALAASSHLEEDSLSQQQGIIPISSVSIDDDSGSLLFDTPSSVAAAAAAMIQNNHVEEEENEDFVTSSSSSRGSWKNDDRVVVVQNGGGVSGGDTCPSEGGSIWRENGAKTKISSLEEEKETNNGVSEETTNNAAASAAVGVNNNGRENDNSSKVVSFAFKKRRGGGHHSNSVRNYRKKHQEEEEEEEEDF